MNLFLFLVWLQMSAQPQINAQDFKMSDCDQPGMTCTIADGWKSLAPPSAPPVGHFECWRDAATSHFSCASPKGSILDVEAALAKLDETAWGNHANGSCLIPFPLLQIPNQPTAIDDITRAEFSEAAQRAADETDGKPQDKDIPRSVIWDGKLDSPRGQITKTEALDRVDVPALQHKKKVNICSGHEYWIPDNMTVAQMGAYCYKVETVTTCADKSRILEHDENSPPKYWCRKVQP